MDQLQAIVSPKALQGYLGQYFYAGNIVLVGMGEVNFVDFGVVSAIGTYGLNSCSVSLVASPYGAILAHIPPRPNLTDNDPYAGDNNTRAIMAEFAVLYTTYIDYFPAAESHIICATMLGQVQLAAQLAIMQQAFLDMGLAAEVHYYDIPVDHEKTGEGTVVVISPGPGLDPLIYIQDELVS